MRCFSAVLALVLATLVWLPSAASADGVLAIVHLPDWGPSPSAKSVEKGSLGAAAGTGEPEARNENADRYANAHSNTEGATPSQSNDLPVAVTTFSTTE
ncbi:MAG TPA: hypothetical protein VIY27_05780 [Myxococcota bacterium]